MTTSSIKDQTRYLIELQGIDTQIYELQKKLDAIPIEIEQKDSEFETKKAKLSELEEQIKTLLLQKKDNEIDLASKEETITKLQTQLYQLKTNKEYAAMLKEIEGAKADKSLAEDKILDIMIRLDTIKAETDKEKSNLTDEQKKMNEDKARLENDSKTITEQIATVKNKRNQIVPNIEKKILLTYERILKSKEGLALVKVANNACQGCFMNVTPQTINEIRMYDRFVICQMCARILYEDEADAV